MFLTSAFVPSFRTRQIVWACTEESVQVLNPDPHRVTIIFSTMEQLVIGFDFSEQREPGRSTIVLWGPGDRVVDWATYGVLTTLGWWGRGGVVGAEINLTEILFEPSGT